MRIETLALGPFEANCHVAWDSSGRALVVDPGSEPERIFELLQAERLTVAAYLITHGHVDHVSALAALHARLPAPIEMHTADIRWAFGSQNQFQPYYPPPSQPSEIARPLADGQEWEEGELRHKVMATPGHSPGGVCFFLPQAGVLFSGDTLFMDSMGRTDLPGGDEILIFRSLRVLAALPPETRILSGHGPETTIGRERRKNQFMVGLLRDSSRS